MIELKLLKDDIYQVIDFDYDIDDCKNYEVLFQGTIVECEAYIRLSKDGYI